MIASNALGSGLPSYTKSYLVFITPPAPKIPAVIVDPQNYKFTFDFSVPCVEIPFTLPPFSGSLDVSYEAVATIANNYYFSSFLWSTEDQLFNLWIGG